MKKALLFTSTLVLSIATGITAYAASPGDIVFTPSTSSEIKTTDEDKTKPFFTFLLNVSAQDAQAPVSYVLIAAASPDAHPYDEQKCPEEKKKQQAQQPVKGGKEEQDKKLVGPEPLYFAF